MRIAFVFLMLFLTHDHRSFFILLQFHLKYYYKTAEKQLNIYEIFRIIYQI